MLLHRATLSVCKYGYRLYPQPQEKQVIVAGINGSHGNDSSTIIDGRIRPLPLPLALWCSTTRAASSSSNNWARIGFVSTAAAAILFWVSGLGTNAFEFPIPYQQPETLSDIPQMLSGSECSSSSSPEHQLGCKKPRIQRPKSRKAESCTIKCVTTCIRGGFGSPGEGPLNVRR